MRQTTCRVVLFSILMLFFGLVEAAEATIIRVPTKEHASIQKGMDAAQNGDTVRVSQGHYYENITLKQNVTLEGGWNKDFSKRDVAAFETIIDGKNKEGWVVLGANHAVLDGFTVINGTRVEKGDSATGAGVHCASTSPTIRNNTIKTNAPAGIYCSGSSAVIEDNRILENEEAGIYLENGCSLTIKGNDIWNNKMAGIGSGGMVTSNIDVRNNVIHDNTLAGIEAKAAIGKVYNNIFYSNKSAGIRCVKVPLDMVNNTVVGNLRSGIVVEDPSLVPVIKNNIITHNEDAGIRAAGQGYSYNLLFANNVTEDCNPYYLWCVRRQYGGYEDEDSYLKNHDIIANPLFVDPLHHDYHLRPTSPGIDGGDPDPKFQDANFPSSLGSAVNDMGAYGGPFALAEKKQPSAPPQANAGPGQQVFVGDRVTLDGKASFDPNGDAISYTWQFTSLPAGSKATVSQVDEAAPSFKADVAGRYEIQLVVKDRWGKMSDPHSVQVEALSNHPPVANAGEIISQVYPGDLVTLYGAGSKDPDGAPLTFTWEFSFKPAGSRATLSDPTGINPTFVVDAQGCYAVKLIVNDGKISSQPHTVYISTRHSVPDKKRRVPADYPTIQAAVDAADPGDEVIVEKGVYQENIVIDKNVNVIGIDWPTIDGGAKDGDVNTIMIPYLGDMAGKIEGFIITGGGKGGLGHGINIWDSSPTIVNNKITLNHHNGMGIHGRAALTGKAEVYNNDISENTIGIGNGRGSEAHIYRNRIYNNRVVGVGCRGQAAPRIEENLIYGNRLGIGAREVASPRIEGNQIFDNADGIDISPISTIRNFADKDIIIRNNLIVDNLQVGIGITSFNLSKVYILNNTIAANNHRFAKRDRAGGIVFGYPFQGTFTAVVENNIITDNTTGGIINYTGTELFPGPGATVNSNHNNIWNKNEQPTFVGCVQGMKDISKDPLFVTVPSEKNGGYYLSQRSTGQKTDSPGVDAGSDRSTKFGLTKKTTRSDKVGDEGVVDLGYHYPTD
jgi:parallel beta-helix repeat protein